MAGKRGPARQAPPGAVYVVVGEGDLSIYTAFVRIADARLFANAMRQGTDSSRVLQYKLQNANPRTPAQAKAKSLRKRLGLREEG